jgi:hypothetical protein
VSDKILDIAELDVIYLSYDEPQCEEFWADLLNKVPWAKRVHGVHGSDNAHRAAGKKSETERFILVDGDNTVDPNFFNQQLTITPETEHATFRWRGYNVVNGLMYGNGGLSSWTRQFVANMNSHENSQEGDAEAKIEFCYGGAHGKYMPMHNVYSTSHPNGSKLHAWRAGFREGVKMSLDRGERVPNPEFKTKIYKQNLNNLCVWMSVGSDVENGLWSILGAREGCFKITHTDWDFVDVRDFKWLNKYWEEQQYDDVTDEWLYDKINMYGNQLKHTLDLDITLLNQEASSFFKKQMKRENTFKLMTTETEVFRRMND